MKAVIDNRKSYRHIIYAIISVACPFIAYGLISLYQEYAYEWYWQIGNQGRPLDDADVNAGAMMGFAVLVEAALAIVVGLIIGTLFAAMSLKRQPRLISFGTAALLFNLIPIVVVVVFFFSVRNGF